MKARPKAASLHSAANHWSFGGTVTGVGGEFGSSLRCVHTRPQISQR